MRVRVYRNLHKQCYSVQAYIAATGWRVIDHVESISLANCEFKVYETGRQKVINEKKKNVHAYVIGNVTGETISIGSSISYNPYKNGYFFEKTTGDPVIGADLVNLAPAEIMTSRAIATTPIKF